MKISFDRDVLIKELSIAQEVIATKTALTILSNILLIAKDGKLKSSETTSFGKNSFANNFGVKAGFSFRI